MGAFSGSMSHGIRHGQPTCPNAALPSPHLVFNLHPMALQLVGTLRSKTVEQRTACLGCGAKKLGADRHYRRVLVPPKREWEPDAPAGGTWSHVVLHAHDQVTRPGSRNGRL